MHRTRKALVVAATIGMAAGGLTIGAAGAQTGENEQGVPPDGFADSVTIQSTGDPAATASTNTDPTTALGAPDCPSGVDDCAYSLGGGGSIVVRFTDNALTASGDDDLDLWIYEVGPLVEATQVSISEDGIDYVDLFTGDEPSVGGSTSGIDIDAWPGVETGVEYRFVRIVDHGPTSGATAGADIDAVGAITSITTPDDPAGHDFDAAEDIEWTFASLGTSSRIDIRIIRQPDGWRGVIVEGCGTDNPAPLLLDEFVPSADGSRWIGTWAPVQVHTDGSGQVTGCTLAPVPESAVVRVDEEGFNPVHAAFGAPGLMDITVGGDAVIPFEWISSSQDITDDDLLRQSYRTNQRFLEWLEQDGGLASRATGTRQLDSVPLFLTTSRNWPDGLAVAGAAGAARGLTLLVDPDNPDRNRRMITKLDPTELVIVGGTAAIPDSAVPSDLGIPVSRVSGATRYTTATEVSRAYFSGPVDFVWVATGRNYPDALGAGANASMNGVPVLLVNGPTIPDTVKAELQRLQPGRIQVAGGTAAVPANVVTELEQYAPVDVFAGANRYATASEIAASEPTARRAIVVPGTTFEHALMASGGAWAGDSPLLLTRGDGLTDDTIAVLQQQGPEQVAIIGDDGDVDLRTRLLLDAFVTGPG